MVRPYSLDLRERVVAAARATGSAAAKSMGERPALLAGQRAFILKRIAVRLDTSIRALRAQLAEAGILVSYGGVDVPPPRGWR